MSGTPTAADLVEQYGVWGNHPQYQAEEWRREVANEDTRLSYWNWVAQMLRAAAAVRERAAP